MVSCCVFVGLHSRTGFPHLRPRPLTSSISFRINTCKSVSKQTTLTLFRMNTYEKHRGVGVLLLTRHPRKGVRPERPSGGHGLAPSGAEGSRVTVLPSRAIASERPRCQNGFERS